MTVESRVFTNDSIPESPTWQRVTTRLAFVNEGSGFGRTFRSLRNALKTLIAAGLDYIVMISGYSLRPVNQHPYIFAGGDSLRDYETLIESVKELDAKVVITTRKSAAAFGVLAD